VDQSLKVDRKETIDAIAIAIVIAIVIGIVKSAPGSSIMVKLCVDKQ